MKIAIVVIAFNRPDHVKRLFGSLQANESFLDFPLILALDGPRDTADAVLQNQMLCELNETIAAHPNLTVSQRPRNLGSKSHITETITSCLAQYEAVIVLEDDLEVGANFLHYMNGALKKYRDCPEVFHISGYSLTSGIDTGNSFFVRYMNCWGWGTWRDRWVKFNDDTRHYVRSFSSDDRRLFNYDNTHDFFRQIEENHYGILNTWAIFWYATIFEAKGLCLKPACSLVNNHGRDGSGERDGQKLTLSDIDHLVLNFPPDPIVNESEEKRLSRYFRENKSNLTEFIKSLVYLLPAQTQKPIMKKLIAVRKFIYSSM